MLNHIPTTILTGFLGSGKTTAINHLLSHKPEGERWGVIVNEFGRIGVDGSLAAAGRNATVREVPGGCLCCTAGIAFETALNRLVRDSRPQRILIEPTGIAHPLQVIRTLTEGFYRDLLDLRAVLCLVDARNLRSKRHMAHPAFIDQLRLADVLLQCKPDLSEEADREALFEFAAAAAPPKSVVREAPFGRVGLDLLELPRIPGRQGEHPEAHRHTRGCAPAPALEAGPGLPGGWLLLEGGSEGLHTAGWRIGRDFLFEAGALGELFGSLRVRRVKGVMQCREGWRAFNGVSGELAITDVPPSACSRLEIIDDSRIAAAELERRLKAAMARC
ncbi:GTP-binding protein [Chlorobium sp. N1]|uniref:CobW family GTP-binding protein n=1 Tax=Chlorobium sp. N1 TaxID=2491138 RepID=UPI001039C06F|nr:GTP-binding protein [Chlorobium sp. N1]TCD47392.1 GTP-binding protein [Chlorobium sp. N1]